MPRISKTEKAKIFSQDARKAVPEDWVGVYGVSEPLFWQECKPVSFWRSFIQDYSIKAIFDVTAGSGCLAEAAMMEGYIYHGLCAAPRGDFDYYN